MSSDDLGEGIQPFSIVLPDYAHSDVGLEAQRLTQTYDIIADGTTTTLQDASVVKTTKVNIPVEFSKAWAHLVALKFVWSVLLGDQHPFVHSYGEFLRTYSRREYSYQTRLRGLGTAAPPAPLLLCYVQLQTVTYWRQALSYCRLPPPPNFLKVLDKIEMQDHSWLPQLPYKYWKPLLKPTSGDNLGSTISSLTFPSTGSSSGGTSSSRGSDRPGTRGTGSSGPGNDTAPAWVPAQNPGVNAIFDPFKERIQSMAIKDAMAKGGAPPTIERDGKRSPMCLSYQLKGLCWSGCRHSDNHGTHSADKDNALLNWCQATYA